MEMKNLKMNTYYGECRCCLTKGYHRNILKEYDNEGVREVYIEIMLDCFNLYLSSNPALSSLICSNCVTRLRDAYTFRTQVLDTERQMLGAVRGNGDTVFVNVTTQELSPSNAVKSEPQTLTTYSVKLESLSDDEEENDMVFDSDFISTDDLIDVPKSSPTDLTEREAALLARFSNSELNPLPTRQTLYNYCPGFVRHLDLLKNVTMTAKTVMMRLQDDNKIIRNKSIHVSEKLAHITNASTLLQYSNLTPFKSKSRSGYPCFYCKNIFEDFHKLREHVQDHKTIEIARVLKQKGPESLVVYAEITDLKCNICGASIPNINELKQHLVKVHKKKMYPEVSDRVIPFKISEEACECQICGCNFETFGAIERHMNGHYRNYVCKDCGSGFVTKFRLKVHAKSMHVDGSFPCEICGKVFSTHQKYKNHVNAVHKMMKRFKCAKCPQRFAEYFKRQRHMEQIHGVAPLKYKCNVCDRLFNRGYTLSQHMKRDHLEERDYQCEICAYKCFTKNELKVHMVKHNGERIYECSICKKSYPRKKTLLEHMKIHNNDRRFACAVCGQAFVQKCSLRGHLKTHHLEHNLQ